MKEDPDCDFVNRQIDLSNARIFQDSSVALETFLTNVRSCDNLQELTISSSVVDLACFDFSPFLDKIGRLRKLEKLVLQGEEEISEDLPLASRILSDKSTVTFFKGSIS